MTRTYFRLWYRLDDTDAYLIWFSNGQDGVVVQPDGMAPSFPNESSLRAYAVTHQLPIEEELPILHDLDVVVRWLRRTLSTDTDCDQFLAAWNLFSDISNSIGGHFNADHGRTYPVYEKLFRGNNLPIFTPPGKQYTPIWTDDEVLLLRETLAVGVALFRSVVKPITADTP